MASYCSIPLCLCTLEWVTVYLIPERDTHTHVPFSPKYIMFCSTTLCYSTITKIPLAITKDESFHWNMLCTNTQVENSGTQVRDHMHTYV